MFVSPFSASHGWLIEWKRVPSNWKPTFLSGINDEKALKAIASIEVIGGAQLSRLFLNGNKTKQRVTFDVKDVLQRLVFFKLYGRFREEGIEPSILPAPQPFVGTLRLGRKSFYVKRSLIRWILK
ncbi:hypothetical protein BSNK01_07560 [Bacillaceae bacterium]